MISIGDRRISVYCDGERGPSPTVILIPAGGRVAEDWATVQPAVSGFSRVCSYGHASHGESDTAPVALHSVDEVVGDLHAWLNASGEKAPFILVSHSISGIYASRFVTQFPGEVAGLVFVDSSHEEQAWRLHELDPQGPGLDDLTARLGYYVKPGQRLQWRTDLPLIVLGSGMPTPRRARDGSNSSTNRMTEEQFAAWDRFGESFRRISPSALLTESFALPKGADTSSKVISRISSLPRFATLLAELDEPELITLHIARV